MEASWGWGTGGWGKIQAQVFQGSEEGLAHPWAGWLSLPSPFAG